MRHLILVFFAMSANALSIDPNVHWRSLRTPHFEIIFDESQPQLAREYAVAAERSYAILQNRFSEKPYKTILVLHDNTDQTNGSATFLPYPLIDVFPVMPDSQSSLDYYGDWPLEMIIHEFTHILTFQPANGAYKPFTYIFGSIVRPNGLLPRWYLEGIAVDSESRFTDFGRLRSPRTFAQLRAFTADNNLKKETVDRINDVLISEYPYGERPYLFGSLLWQAMIEQGPKDLPELLNQRYSRRLPYIINEPIENILGSDYAHLLENRYDELAKIAKEQMERIESAGKEEIQPFPIDDMENFGPSLSPDKTKLIYISSSLRRSQIKLMERFGNRSFRHSEAVVLFNALAPLRVSWLPDSSGFVCDQIDDRIFHNSYRTLYRFDLGSKKLSRLVPRLRGQEPGVSLKGDQVVFIRNQGATTILSLLNLETKEVRDLLIPQMFERISHPEFLSEHTVAFTHRDRFGNERLKVIDLASNKLTIPFAQLKEPRRPTRTSLGLLVGTLDNGVENISVLNLAQGSEKPITNTTTGIQSAEFDSVMNELITTRYTGSGRRLFVQAPKTAKLQNIARPFSWEKTPQPIAVDPNSFKEESYQPIEYLYPRFWIPFAYPVYNGVYLQGTTEARDPAGINAYALSAAYDTVTSRGSYGIQYVNSSLPPDIELSYMQTQTYLGASGYVLTDRNAAGDLAFHVPGLSRFWTVKAGYLYDHLDTPFSYSLNRQGPLAEIVFSNWEDSRHPTDGTILRLSHKQYLDGPDQVAYGRSVIGITQGWSPGLPKNHRIFAQAQAMLAPDLPFSNVLSLGDSSLANNSLVNLTNSQFLMRGFGTGTFIGRRLLNFNLEYQFPMSTKTKGWGTFPVFSRGWDGAVVCDGIAVDGASYDYKDEVYRRRYLNEFALSTGFEGRWNSTFFYGLPLTWIFGLYGGFDDKARNQIYPFIGIAATDLSVIDHMREKWFKNSPSRL